MEVAGKKTSATLPAPTSAKKASKSIPNVEPVKAKPEKVEAAPKTNPPNNATAKAVKKTVSKPTTVPAKFPSAAPTTASNAQGETSAAYKDDNDGSEEKCDCAACTIM